MSSLNSLVAYGDSDEGSDQEQPSAPVKPTAAPKKAPKRPFLVDDTFGASLPKASSLLPSFKPDASGKVKIFVPKVEEDEEEDVPSKKQTPVSDSEKPKTRCALFSILPPPRVPAGLIPPSVAGRRRAIATEEVEWGAKSRPVAVAQSAKVPEKAAEIAPSAPPPSKQPVRDGSSDEEDGQQNFFSIGETSSISVSKKVNAVLFDYGTEIGPAMPKATPQISGASSQQNEFSGIFGPAKPPSASAFLSASFKHTRIDIIEGQAEPSEEEAYDEDEYDEDEPNETGYRAWLATREESKGQEGASSSSSSLDIEELRKMQGRHNKGEAINIIECKADDLLDPAEYARQKTMDEARAALNGPNPMAAPRGRAKSRHQITYLAWMAKERETELKEFWASSNMNKAQARLKYGF